MKYPMPVHMTPQRSTREALWDAIRRLQVFTIPDLFDDCDLAHNTMCRYLAALVKAGILASSEDTRPPQGKSYPGNAGRRRTYRLLKDSVEPPRVRADGSLIDSGQGNQKAWNTMRKRKIFTLADLHALSSTTQRPVERSALRQYLKYLEYAGYIRKTKGIDIDTATYRLVRDTGPKAPQIQRVKQVWDPNIRKVTWPLSAPEVIDGK